MKKFLVLFAVLLIPGLAVAAAEKTPAANAVVTEMKITEDQLIEFENSGMVTLLDAQKKLLVKNAGFSPSVLELWYAVPSGEKAIEARNIAVKVSQYDIKVLHRFLQKDDPAALAQRKKEKAAMAGRESPQFYVDADGWIWHRSTPRDFEKYIAAHKADIPHSMVDIRFGVPPATTPAETVVATDVVRRLQRIAKKAAIPSMVCLEDGEAVSDLEVRRPMFGHTRLLPEEVPDAEKRLRAIAEFFCKQTIAGNVKDLSATHEVPDVWGDALGAGWSLPDTLSTMGDDLRDGYTVRILFGNLDEEGKKVDRMKPKPGERDLSPGRSTTHSIIILTKKGGLALRMCYVDAVKKFMITSYLPLKGAVKETPPAADGGKLPE